MPWLIDTDVFIEGERGNPAFLQWLEKADAVATADIVRAEFLIGVHAVASAALRQRGAQFYSDRISLLPSFASDPFDYAKGAALAGEARRLSKGKPGLADGLLAALALRTGAKVATRNHGFQSDGLSLCQSTRALATHSHECGSAWLPL